MQLLRWTIWPKDFLKGPAGPASASAKIYPRRGLTAAARRRWILVRRQYVSGIDADAPLATACAEVAFSRWRPVDAHDHHAHLRAVRSVMSSAVALGIRAAMFTAQQARKFWKQNLGRSLDREVRRAIEKESTGRRSASDDYSETLQRDWEAVRRDQKAAYYLKALLKHPSTEAFEGLEQRVLAIVRAVDHAVAPKDREERLVQIVRRSLLAAQPDGRASAEYAGVALLGGIEELRADVRALQAGQVPSALMPAPRVALVLPGDVDAREAAILNELRAANEDDAARLARAVQRGGAAAASELLANEALSFDLSMAVGRMLMLAGAWVQASGAFGRAVDTGEGSGRALVAQAIAEEVSGNESRARELLARAEQLDPDDPTVQIELASRIENADHRASALDALQASTPRLRARLLAEQASARLAQGHYREAGELATQSRTADPLGPGDEMEATATIFRAADDVQFCVSDRRRVRQAAESLSDLVKKLRDVGRFGPAQLCQARAALGFALCDEDSETRSRCEDAIAHRTDVEEGAATWIYVQAALAIGDGDLASRFAYEQPQTEHEKLLNLAGRVFSGRASSEDATPLAELSASHDRDVASYADNLRLVAADTPAFPIPTDVCERLGPNHPAVRRMEAFRLAEDDGAHSLARARAHLDGFDDVESLTASAELARRDSDFTAQAALLHRVYDHRPTPFQGLLVAQALSQIPDLKRARREAENVARRTDAPRQVRMRAYALAAQCAANDGAWSEMERVATEWLALSDRSTRATWALLFALAKQESWEKAAALLDPEHIQVDRLDEAELIAAVVVRSEVSASALRTLTNLSDQFERPESLEYAVLTASLGSEHLIDTGSALDARIRATFDDFGNRFPRSELVRSVDIDPDDPIGSLERAMPQVSPAVEQLRQDAEAGIGSGTVPLAMLADLVGRPTIEVLVRRGPLPLGPGTDGEADAASRALASAGACWTADALAIVGGLPHGMRSKVERALPNSVVSQTVFAETARTAPGGAVVGFAVRGSDGRLRIHEADQDEETRVVEALTQATRLAKSFRACAARATETTPGDLARAFSPDMAGRHAVSMLQTIELARQEQRPLFAADRAVRRLATEFGVPSFGVNELFEMLCEEGVWTPEEKEDGRARLRFQGVWGISANGFDYVELGRRTGWDPGHRGWQAVWSDLAAVKADTPGWISRMAHVLATAALENPCSLPNWAETIAACLVRSGISTYEAASTALISDLLKARPEIDDRSAAKAIDAVMALRFLEAYPYVSGHAVLRHAIRSEIDSGATIDAIAARLSERTRPILVQLSPTPNAR